MEINLTVKKKNKTLPRRCAPGSAKSLTRLYVVYKKQSQNESSLFFFLSFQTFSFLFGKITPLPTFVPKGCLKQENPQPSIYQGYGNAGGLSGMVPFPRIWPFLHFADYALHFATRYETAKSQQTKLARGEISRRNHRTAEKGQSHREEVADTRL